MEILAAPKTLEKEVAILYVDDEEVNLFLFKKNFEGDYPVFVAHSGVLALEILEEQKDKIVVVISDFRMPRMNGIQFINEARKRHDKIIYFMLTGYGQNQEITEALENNIIYECFNKPFPMELLEEKIMEALQNYWKN